VGAQAERRRPAPPLLAVDDEHALHVRAGALEARAAGLGPELDPPAVLVRVLAGGSCR
jgi:hypothetical protein